MLLPFICRDVHHVILKRTDTIYRERREERHYNPASTAVATDDTTTNRVSELYLPYNTSSCVVVSERLALLYILIYELGARVLMCC